MARKMAKGSRTHSRWVRTGFLILVIVGLGAFIVYKFWLPPLMPGFARVPTFQERLLKIETAISKDSVREYHIRKIIQIISTYNENMSSGIKYEIADEIYEMSLRYKNLDVNLICATITYESGGTWDPEIVSATGAMGLFQILPSSGLWIAHYEGITWDSPKQVLFDPIYNIRIGCRKLDRLVHYYDLEGGLAAFNGGEKKAALWMAQDKATGLLWPETNTYIPNVMALYRKYKAMVL